MSETLEIRSAKKSEKGIVEALMQDYMAEFATFEPVEQDADGKYVYPYLPHYWGDPNRYPFLIRVGEDIAGFALLRFEANPLDGQGEMEMAEFYVTPPFRRSAVGTRTAVHLWNLFPGKWVVRVLKSNKNAYPFWKRAIDDYTGGQYQEQAPAQAIGGFISFTFESATDASLPDNIEPDLLDL